MRQTQRQRSGCGGVSKHRREHDGSLQRPLRTDEDRDNRQEFGVANENVRKLILKDDSGNKAAKTDGVLDLTIANMCDRMKIPLGKILCDHEPYAPYGMCDFEYRIALPQSKKIMKAQDSEDIGEYKLTDLHLEYEIIESENLVREVEDQYSIGRSLGYDYTTMLKTLLWNKGSTTTSQWRVILTTCTAKVSQSATCTTK